MRVAATYLGVILIWSTTPLAIFYSIDTLPFVAALAFRMWIGLALCLVLLKLWRIPFPITKSALHCYAYGGIAVTGAMLCVYWAAETVPSGLIAVLWGVAPMLVSLYSQWLLPGKHLTFLRLWSIALALAGLSLVFSGQMNVSMAMLPGLMMVVLAVNLHAVSSVLLVREKIDLHPLAQTTGALLLSAPMFAIAWWIDGSALPHDISLKSLGGVLYLAVMGSVVGFVSYYYLLKHLPVATVSLTTLITPVFALALGTVLENEQIALNALLGAGVIMGALALYHGNSLSQLLQNYGAGVLQKAKKVKP